ncbi:MFS transporter [Brevundimonas sp.]|uniref:MFS transporter n=1 Tax=Brevundimonas sp. TaxID=1871086 RepID=UPI001A333860|nr:MFS transporter [Brevundimonas sp.]MBJ7483080.1 MFS transporter [Brevundimonas sp.]
MTNQVASSTQEWRRGWSVVLAAAGGMALSTANVYSTGVFMGPLQETFGWSRTEISAGLSIGSLAAVVCSPFIGLAVDRFGPRRIGIAGAIAFCAAWALFSTVQSSIWTWWAVSGLLAIASLGVGPTIWTAAVSSLFFKSRGLALAVLLCGIGVGSAVTPILSSVLVTNLGWRGAYLGLAGIWALVIIPLLILLFTSAKDRDRVGPEKDKSSAVALSGVGVREGLRSLRFVKLAVSGFILAGVGGGIAINMVPIMMSLGASKASAAGLAALLGLSSMVGRLSVGILLDRFNANMVAASVALIPIPALLLLLGVPGSPVILIVAILALGLALGGELDCLAYLTSRHFGLKSFGTLFGTIGGAMALSVGMAPVLISYAFDRTGSYALVLWIAVPLCLIASAFVATLGRFRPLDADLVRSSAN